MDNRRYIKKGFATALAFSIMMGGMATIQNAAVQQVYAAATASSVATLTNQSSISSYNITKGQKLTFNAAASGGTGGYTYAFFYKKAADTKWSTAKNFSTTQSVSIYPATATIYNLCIKVKDSSGAISKKYFDVTVQSALQNLSTVNALTIAKGSQIEMKGIADGGSGGYTYSFLYKKQSDTSWTMKQNFSSNNYAAITPATATTYNLCIKIKDSNGAISKKYFDVNVQQQLKNLSTVSTSEISQGKNVTLIGSASGQNGGFQYAYFYKKSDATSWKTLKNFSTQKSVSFKPDSAGEYDLCIKVKDSKNLVEKLYFTLTVTPNPANEITSRIITDSMTDIQKVKAIHDWLVNNVEYDTKGYNSGNISAESYTAEGLFKNRVAVCDGYSKAFLAMAECAGLDSVRITGIAYNSSSSTGESHSWNQVKVNGKWYNIDVTWDDPIITNSNEDNLSYQYFLIPDSVINRDHVAGNGAKYNCTSPQPLDLFLNDVINDEISGHQNWCYCESESDLDTKLNAFIKKGIMEFTVIYKTNETDQNKIANTMFSHCKNIRTFNFRSIQWKFDGYYKITIKVTT